MLIVTILYLAFVCLICVSVFYFGSVMPALFILLLPVAVAIGIISAAIDAIKSMWNYTNATARKVLYR